MTIDNRFTTAKTRMFFLIIIVLSITTFAYGFFDKTYIRYITFSLSALLTITYFFSLMLNLHYFYLKDETTKLIIRFYNAHPFLRKYRAIEIPLNQINSFEIDKSIFGFKKNLIISIKTIKGEGKYPPISISLLNSTEIERLENTLNKIIANNK